MSSLLVIASRRYWRRRPFELGLALAGIAVGVAVVVAIDLANQSAARAFDLATDTVTGSATHQVIGGPEGLPEAAYTRLVLEAAAEPAAPMVDEMVRLAGSGGRNLRLLGVDPFAEAPLRAELGSVELESAGGEFDVPRLLGTSGMVVATAATAAELGLTPGERFAVEVGGRRVSLELAGLLRLRDAGQEEGFANVLLADLATAQEVLGMAGFLTRIDLVVPPGDAGEALLARARQVLPPGAQVLEAAGRSRATAGLTAAFRLNLEALSLLALLCGAFLVYNTVRFSVVERREVTGRLRALGVTGSQLLRLTLTEAAALGLVGALLGLLLGVALGHLLVGLVARTIDDLYFAVAVRRLVLPAAALAQGLALGVGAALVAAWGPAREAAAVPPRLTSSRAELEAASLAAAPRHAWLGAGLLALAALLLLPREPIQLAFAGVFCLLLGAAAMVPQATLLLLDALAGPLGRLGLFAAMAGRGVRRSLSRTGVALAALCLAVAMSLGVGVMIDSFRGTVERWLESALPADLYLSPGRLGSGRHQAPLPADLAARLAGVPGVDRVNTVRRLELEGPDGLLRLAVIEVDRRGRRAFPLRTGAESASWRSFEDGDAVFISEPLAYRRGLHRGDALRLPTGGGPRAFEVAGVFTDFSSEHGLVLVSRVTFERHWTDRGYDGLSFFLQPGADAAATAAAIAERAADVPGVFVRSNRALRGLSLEVFDRTFRVTGVLRQLAGGVAFLGILGALSALALERRRELAVLAAVGLTPGQRIRLVLAESGLLGLVAGLFALPLGLMLAAILVFVINRRSFGWTLEMAVAPEMLAGTLTLAVASAVLAGIYPARRMAREKISDGLKQE